MKYQEAEGRTLLPINHKRASDAGVGYCYKFNMRAVSSLKFTKLLSSFHRLRYGTLINSKINGMKVFYSYCGKIKGSVCQINIIKYTIIHLQHLVESLDKTIEEIVDEGIKTSEKKCFGPFLMSMNVFKGLNKVFLIVHTVLQN